MKLMYLVALAFFVNVALVFTGVSEPITNVFFDFLRNPTDWNSLTDSTGWLGLVLLGAGVGIIVGAMVFRNENLLWYGVAAAFLSFGTPLVDLYRYVNSSVGGDGGTLLANVFVAPLILVYIFVVIYWARGRD
jgi:hypothetical protein